MFENCGTEENFLIFDYWPKDSGRFKARRKSAGKEDGDVVVLQLQATALYTGHDHIAQDANPVRI